jgi:hypothetical protein
MYAGKIALGAPPDNTQGYGRVTMKNVLPLKDTYIFDLFVDDLQTIGSYSMLRYNIQLGAYAVSVPIKYDKLLITLSSTLLIMTYHPHIRNLSHSMY